MRKTEGPIPYHRTTRLDELFRRPEKCELHNVPQPCIVCALLPKIPVPKPAPILVPAVNDDDGGDQRGVD